MLFEPDWEPDFGGAAETNGSDVPASDTDRSRLLSALSVTPVPVDALIAGTGLTVPVIQTLLLELDLAGRIEWSSGQLVALKS